MKKFIYIILLILIGSFVKAQDASQQFLYVNNNFTENKSGVVLKWISSEVYFDGGCKVYRKENSSWELLTPNSIYFQKSNINNLSEDSKSLHKMVLDTEYSEFKDGLARMFVLIQGVFKPAFADVLGIQYFDETAQIGKTYTYKVMGTSEGIEKQIGEETSITVQKYQKSLPPQQILTERKKGEIMFKWEPELARYYGIYIYKKTGEEETFNRITEVPYILQKVKKQNGETQFPEVFYKDEAVLDDMNYTYKVTAIDFFGQESTFSEELFVKAKDFIFPQIPFNLTPKAFALEQKVVLTWQFIEETDLEGFNVYRSKQSDGGYTKVNNILLPKENSRFEDIVPEVGNYYYYVSTVDFSGNETKSGLVYTEVRDLIPPAAPQNLKILTEPGIITLNWSANSEKDLKGYFIQRSLNDSNNLDNHYININENPIIETSYTENLAKKIRNKFVYRVIAVDTSYNRSKPSINSLAQMPDVTPPNNVLIKKIEEIEGQLVINWLANVEEDLKGYNIYKRLKGDSGSYYQVNFSIIPKYVLFYIDRSAEEGKIYEYIVKAEDENKNLSDASKAFLGGIKLKKGEAIISIEEQKLNKKNVLQLEWKNQNENYDIKGYVVFKGLNEGQLKPISGMLTETELREKLPNKTETYLFQIRGYANSGEVIKTELLTITTEKRAFE